MYAMYTVIYTAYTVHISYKILAVHLVYIVHVYIVDEVDYIEYNVNNVCNVCTVSTVYNLYDIHNIYIAYEIWLGGAAKMAKAAGGSVQNAHKTLCWFVLVGWAIYPIGYMAGTPGWYEGIFGSLSMDVFYNVADAINKIGFGLVIYNLALQQSKSKVA